ncbi:hypothetical protein E4O93_16250 [Diaphorobacter sp. DS2]|nr:hypothetical protein E4O93_16250 [Diaphorobacter sp. DS2]
MVSAVFHSPLEPQAPAGASDAPKPIAASAYPTSAAGPKASGPARACSHYFCQCEWRENRANLGA